jgi:hypothetical protein
MAKRMLKCLYCGQYFDANSEPTVQVRTNRYAHKKCADNQIEIDKERIDLEDYIKQLFQSDKVPSKVQKQINSYVKDYNFTYTGMLKALVYHFEIQHGDISKSNGGIGIVPYVYDQAKQYYYTLWMAQQQNIHKDITEYIPKVEEYKIQQPTPKKLKRKLFSFLDEDNGGS